MAQFGFYRENQEKNRIQQITGWIVDIVAAAALALFAVSMMINPTVVGGRSMEPSLYADDTVLMSRISPDVLRIRRYEVVEFRVAEDDRQTSIKRVVGLPGETIRIQDGMIYINGIPLSNSRYSEHPITIAGLAGEDVVLGKDEYFVLGDNTGSSEDSRFEGVGNIRQDQITGRAWLRIAPVSRFGFLVGWGS